VEGDTRVEEAVASAPVDIEPAVPVDIVDTTAQALGTHRGRGRGRTPVSRKPRVADPQASSGQAEAGAVPERRAAKRPARAAKPKAEKPAKAEKAPKMERRRTPRKPRGSEAADSSNS
jgi:hypothetical protein